VDATIKRMIHISVITLELLIIVQATVRLVVQFRPIGRMNKTGIPRVVKTARYREAQQHGALLLSQMLVPLLGIQKGNVQATT
jgi:hypothetical protein